MSETSNNKELRLSNDGFNSFIKDYEEVSLVPYISSGNKHVEIKLSLTGKKFSIIEKPKEFSAYSERLKSVIEKRKIHDSDKVFFTKNSTYPRTAFNRYSNKARRVQDINKADKIVIATDILSNSTYSSLCRVTDRYIVSRSRLNGLSSILINFISNNLDNIEDSCPLKKIFVDAAQNSYYGYSSTVHAALATKAHESIEKNIPSYRTANCTDLNIYLNLNDKDTLRVLREGHPISKFMADPNVNTYIDKFKDVLDGDSYSMVLSCLKGDNSQVSLGLKLLENMDISNSKAYLYSLFLEAGSHDRRSSSRRPQVIYNNVFSSVGIKNMVKAFDLRSMYDSGYNKYVRDVVAKMYKKLEGQDDQQEILLTATKDLVLVEVKENIGLDVYNYMISNELYKD